MGIVSLALAGTITAFAPLLSQKSFNTSLRATGIGGFGLNGYQIETKFFAAPKIGNKNIGQSTPAITTGKSAKLKSTRGVKKVASTKVSPDKMLTNFLGSLKK